MTTTTRSFDWRDTGAPTLEGVAGSFKDLMKLLLLGDGSGVAYGSGASQKLAAGWSNAFPADETTTKIVMRNSMAAGGSGCYLRILDDGSGAGGAKEALIQVYESMSDIDTGTAPASSNGSSAGVWIRKSESAAAGARAWVVAADERTFYINTYSNSASPPTPSGTAVGSDYSTIGGGGDYLPAISGDPGIFVAGQTTANQTQYRGSSMARASRAASTQFAGLDQGFALSRDNTLATTPVAGQIGFYINTAGASQVGFGGSSAPMGAASIPGIVGAQLCLPAWVFAQSGFRGRMRGLYIPLNQVYLACHIGDSVVPLGSPAGSSMLVMSGLSDAANSAICCARMYIEQLLSWDS